MKKSILSFGELLWDMMPNASILGGAPFNLAYRLHELGEDVLFVSRLGRDKLGENALIAVESMGLDTSLLQRDESYLTGTVDVSLDMDNNPDYVIKTGVAYDNIEINDRLEAMARQADCFCFGTLVQRDPRSREILYRLLLLAAKALKFLDINLRKDCFTPKIIHSSLQAADILKLNYSEVNQLIRIFGLKNCSIPEFCEMALKRWGLEFCLVTLGENGAFAAGKNGEQVYTSGYRVDIVDTIGSGDAFSAGFISGILKGESLNKACESGNILGALTATKIGATDFITLREISEFHAPERKRIFSPLFREKQ